MGLSFDYPGIAGRGFPRRVEISLFIKPIASQRVAGFEGLELKYTFVSKL